MTSTNNRMLLTDFALQQSLPMGAFEPVFSTEGITSAQEQTATPSASSPASPPQDRSRLPAQLSCVVFDEGHLTKTDFREGTRLMNTMRKWCKAIDLASSSSTSSVNFDHVATASNAKFLTDLIDTREPTHFNMHVFAEAFQVLVTVAKHTHPDILAAHCAPLVYALVRLSSCPTVSNDTVKVARMIARKYLRNTGTRFFRGPSPLCLNTLWLWASWQVIPIRERAQSPSSGGKLSKQEMQRLEDDRSFAIQFMVQRMCTTDDCFVDEDIISRVRRSYVDLSPTLQLTVDEFLERVQAIAPNAMRNAVELETMLEGQQEQQRSRSRSSTGRSVSPQQRPSGTPNVLGVMTVDGLREALRDRLLHYVQEEEALHRAIENEQRVRSVMADDAERVQAELQDLLQQRREQLPDVVSSLLQGTHATTTAVRGGSGGDDSPVHVVINTNKRLEEEFANEPQQQQSSHNHNDNDQVE